MTRILESIRLGLLIVLLLIPGCRNLEGPQLWPPQRGATDVVKYYDGDMRSIQDLAVLHVREPYCVVHDRKNFRKSFALKPGYYQMMVAYFKYNASGAVTESLEPVAIDFVVEPKHVYRFYHVEYQKRMELADSPEIWAPFLMDVTNDQTIMAAIANCPFPGIKKEMLWLFRDSARVVQLLKNETDNSVREAARLKLIRMVNVEKFVLKFPTVSTVCDAINEISDTEFIGEIFIHYEDLPPADCAKSRLLALSEAKTKRKHKKRRVMKNAAKKIRWLKHNARW